MQVNYGELLQFSLAFFNRLIIDSVKLIRANHVHNANCKLFKIEIRTVLLKFNLNTD